MTALNCWRCGASLKAITLPIERLAQCTSCGADLHVCRLCKFYNPQLHDKCDHDMAEPAREVDIANFCDYFHPRGDAHDDSAKTRSDDAMSRLKNLFGGESSTERQTQADQEASDSKKSKQETDRDRFDALFKKD